MAENNEHAYNVIVHKLGTITCFCGYNDDSHEREIKGKIKFSKCYEDQCPLCYEEYNYSLQQYKKIDGYVVCGQCNSELGNKSICTDCFCGFCFEFLSDCQCCKFCGHQTNAQCSCYDSDVEENSKKIVQIFLG